MCDNPTTGDTQRPASAWRPFIVDLAQLCCVTDQLMLISAKGQALLKEGQEPLLPVL